MKTVAILLVVAVLGGLLYSGLKMSRQNQTSAPVATSSTETTMTTTTTANASLTPAASVSPQDQKWESTQQTSTGNDDTSLEKDINGTDVPTEDFSDLK